MNSVGIFNDAIMYAKGYKKVALKDTKGVLTNANNYKWVKHHSIRKANVTTQVLPTGTVTQKIAEKNTLRTQKKVIKPDYSGYYALQNFGFTKGTFNVCEMKKFEPKGIFKPEYFPAERGDIIAHKSENQVKQKLILSK